MIRRARGWTVIELLVGVFIVCVLLIGLVGLMSAVGSAQSVTYDVTASARDARNVLDTMAEHLRSAQMCDASLSCGYTDTQAIQAASASDITYCTFDGTTWGKVRYYLSGTNLMRQVNGGTASTALPNVTSFSMTYYKTTTNSGNSNEPIYNTSSLTTCTAPSAPTSAELPLLNAIKLTASTTTDGRTVQFSTLVRLRNSPKKYTDTTSIQGN